MKTPGVMSKRGVVLFTNTCHKNARIKYKTLRLVAVAFTTRYSS